MSLKLCHEYKTYCNRNCKEASIIPHKKLILGDKIYLRDYIMFWRKCNLVDICKFECAFFVNMIFYFSAYFLLRITIQMNFRLLRNVWFLYVEKIIISMLRKILFDNFASFLSWWPWAIIFFVLYCMIPWHCQTYISNIYIFRYIQLHVSGTLPPTRSIHKTFDIQTHWLLATAAALLYHVCMEWLQYDSIINLAIQR